jgi:hypothetical protein
MHESIMEFMEKLFPEESVTILIEKPKEVHRNTLTA